MSRVFLRLQWVVWLIIGVGASPLIFVRTGFSNTTVPSSTHTHKKRVMIDRLEASVNSSIILLSDVEKFRNISKLRAQLDPLFSGTPLANKGNGASDKDIIDFLISERLISLQFPKSDTEIEQEINSIQSNNRLDREGLKSALEKEGYTFSDYFELIRSSSSKRDLIDRDIRTKVTVSDDDVKNYFYNNYVKNTAIPRAYDLRIISISNSSFKSPAVAKKAAIDALKSIQSGESFEEVAKRVSDDPTASSGGDLGTLTEDQMSKSIREQVKNLRIGQVSEIFTGGTADHYYMIKLVGVRSSESDRFEKMKDEIRNHLTAAAFQHQIELWLDRQKQSAFVHHAGELSFKELPSVP